ncbi:dTMP kinase [Skermania sp. ID1734]|uniref:dTMP kinase n=1 Tax=Skermania sp. ID1734 TaxID=2597516 RepID=UPI0011815613|nr:dTMP kinase [Skermania sp. ID1734]TSD97345.1 dTMP kinase [Skermania sp. ID1734]
MGVLIAIEGVDGAGKQTLSRALTRAWESAGIDVLRMGFPRYGESAHADLAAEALHGEHGDLAASVYGMATLFALDRHGAATDLHRMVNRHDVVLLDRYVASNAAYGAARLGEPGDGPVVKWIRELEIDRLAVPPPTFQILLQVPAEVADKRARQRERNDATRARDSYERDGDLQRRTAEVYAQLAEQRWISDWKVLDGTEDPAQLAADLINQLLPGRQVTP